jgi:hypothetical protein
MMMSLSDDQMLSFCGAWPWIVSDRVAELDDELHRPISATSAVQAHTRVLIGKCETIEPDEPVDIRLGYFREMLSSLQDEGENIRKIYDWARSLSRYMQELNARRAMGIWRETFERFARGKRAPAKHIDEDVLEGLSESFLRDAYKPWLDFSMRVRRSEKKWLSDRGRRTEFDELLWDNFFGERDVDPGNIASLGYGEMLVREWWRVVRTPLSEEQITQLRREQIETTKAFAKSRIPSWKVDDSIDETMVYSGFPPFDTLRP